MWRGGCQFDRVDELSRERNRNADIWAVWVWVRDPDAIPKVAHLSLMDRLVEEAEDHHQDPTHPPPSPMLTCSREGLRYQVLVHLSVLEDFAPKDLLLGTGLDGPTSDEEDEYPSRVHFFWTAGVPDGSGRQHRRRAGDVLSRLGPRRDDKDDDEDRDDRADRASFQSESRARALGRA